MSLGVFLIFLKLLSLDLWPKMWSVLENVPCALEKDVYSISFFFFGCNILKIPIKSNCSIVSFRILLILCCLIDSLSRRSVYWCEWRVKVSYYYCVPVNFSLYVCWYLFYVFWCSNIGCIYVDKCRNPLLVLILLSLYSVLLYLSLWPLF